MRLGALAGLSMALPYLGFVFVHMLASAIDRGVYLGGRGVNINGTVHTELPAALAYAGLLAMPLFGILLARVVTGARRPPWWQVAPIGWLSVAGSLLYASLASRTTAVFLTPAVGYALFGLLLGACLHSRKAALVLLVAAPVTWFISTVVAYSGPGAAIIAGVAPYQPGHLSFELSVEALNQATIHITHGVALAGVLLLLDSRVRGAAAQQGDAAARPLRGRR